MFNEQGSGAIASRQQSLVGDPILPSFPQISAISFLFTAILAQLVIAIRITPAESTNNQPTTNNNYNLAATFRITNVAAVPCIPHHLWKAEAPRSGWLRGPLIRDRNNAAQVSKFPHGD